SAHRRPSPSDLANAASLRFDQVPRTPKWRPLERNLHRPRPIAGVLQHDWVTTTDIKCWLQDSEDGLGVRVYLWSLRLNDDAVDSPETLRRLLDQWEDAKVAVHAT